MVTDSLLGHLADDLAALQRDGLDAARSDVYRRLLALGTLAADQARDAAAGDAVAVADRSACRHLQVLARLVALVLQPGDQRRTTGELLALLGHEPHGGEPAPPRGRPGVRLRLLEGRLERDGATVALTERDLALLAALAARRRPVPTAELAEMLLPDVDLPTAANIVRVQVHRLRTRAGDAGIVRCLRRGYVLDAAVAVDLDDAEALLARPETGPDLLALAAHVEREPPYQFWPQEWAAAFARRVDGIRSALAMRVASHAAAAGAHDEALHWCDKACAVESLHDAAHELRVRVLLAAGRPAEAALAFRRYRDALRAELDVEPSAQIARLFSRAV